MAAIRSQEGQSDVVHVDSWPCGVSSEASSDPVCGPWCPLVVLHLSHRSVCAPAEAVL